MHAFKLKYVFQCTDECGLDYALRILKYSEDFGPTYLF